MSSRRVPIGAAVLVAVLVATLTSLGRSDAAFFATTTNSADSFTAGTGFDTGALYTWGDTGDAQLVPGQIGTATWTTVAVGDHFGCGVQTDGSLWCWGNNNVSGQQGVGDTVTHYLPQKVGTGTWTAVGTGANHTCAVRSDQTLWCWGDGANGKLGLGSTTNYSTPQQVTSPAATGWATVAGGTQFTCATRTDGTLYCFGANGIGQTGNGTTTSPQSSPVQVSTPSTTGWATVALGYQHAYALRTDNTLYCWGDGGSGRLGQGSTAAFSSPQQVAGTTWTGLGLGTDHSCAIKAAGTLWCWGANGSGQLGSGGTSSIQTPAQVGSATTWRTVAGGSLHTCGTRTDNTLWCWGGNTYGQLGQNDATGRTTATQVGALTTWSGNALGGYPNQACSIRTGGTLWCWGDTQTVRFTPVQVGTDMTYRSAAAGANFGCAVRQAGTLWCWGTNSNGQLGIGTTASSYAPAQVGAGTTWSQVTAGISHTCATTTDGRLWCWGGNGDGQLGTGTTTNASSPVQVTTPSGTGWAAVSAGARDTCATRTDGELFCFGRNLSGEAAQGTYASPQSTPVQVTTPAATGWASVALGYQHVCALRTDRTLYCWGDGGSGRTGHGNTATTNTPQPVTGASWWVLGAGTDHTCAIKLNGTLWCWGAGGSGRLGLGTTADSTTPAQVGTAGTWRTVVGGNVQTCAVKSDNTVWCWGGNAKGQLGIGSATGNLSVPTQLTGYPGRPAVAGPGSDATGLILS